jgi:hypothetical protein
MSGYDERVEPRLRDWIGAGTLFIVLVALVVIVFTMAWRTAG